MAWLEKKENGTFHVVFRLGDDRYRRSLKTKRQKEALSRQLRIEENIKLVETGRLTVPTDADLVAFLLSDGKLDKRVSGQKQLQLGKLYATYNSNLPADSMEVKTLKTAANHMRHLSRILGSRLPIRTLSTTDLQKYVNQRSLEPGMRGRTVSSVTIKKELATLRAIWNWAKIHDYTAKTFPLRGVIFPKSQERPPYQTRDEIERQISGNGMSDRERKEAWECLYLNVAEIKEILCLVKEQSDFSHVYPMVAVAAFTGVRRSELCRLLTTDMDLQNGTILIREKKRSKSKRTFRQVPIASGLKLILTHWFAEKPPSRAAFPSMRYAEGTRVACASSEPASAEEASDHLKHALRHTKWTILKGWHVFRHSFISNCASQGVDQRMIDDWVGHQTDEQRKRYRHLFPDTQKREIDRVF